jgi:hypothetical protein
MRQGDTSVNQNLAFREITDRLGLSAAATAKLIGRSSVTVRHYRSVGKHSRVPPPEVMAKLEGHWRSQLPGRLERAVADLRDVGLVVEIGWGPMMQRAAGISASVEAAVAEGEVA